MHDKEAPLSKAAMRFDVLSEYFDGKRELGVLERANALCVSGILDGSTSAVFKMFTNGANGARELYSAPVTTETFLVIFGRDCKDIALEAQDAWREYGADVCHRMGDLRIIASGLSLTRERYERSRDFFRDLAFWTHLYLV